MGKQFFLIFLASCIFVCNYAFAGTPASDKVAVEAKVKTELDKDLASPLPDQANLVERTCLDGRKVEDFKGDVIEFWVNLECSYCGIAEPLQAQKENPAICIVARHIPAPQYGESLKKALVYEALRGFSINAANRFWNAIIPQTSLGIPVPYGSALNSALAEAVIEPEIFAEAVEKSAPVINNDIIASKGNISTSPTYIMAGIRFPACDFKASQIPAALNLAKKARTGDESVKSEIISIITRGILNEKLL